MGTVGSILVEVDGLLAHSGDAVLEDGVVGVVLAEAFVTGETGETGVTGEGRRATGITSGGRSASSPFIWDNCADTSPWK